jgi:hypothetical protein
MLKTLIYSSPLIEFAIFCGIVQCLFLPEGLSPANYWLIPYINVCCIILLILLCVVIPLICSLILVAFIKRSGWKQNLIDLFLVVTHTIYPSLFLYQYFIN